jgi:hypothetical protein
MLPQF